MQADLVINERIDRNGTKHQEIETDCSRCAGQGRSDKWMFTGKTCYKCGGIGRVRAKRKVYTAEHQKKLDAAKAKREAIKEAEKQEKWESEAPERAAKIEKQLQEKGYFQEKIYVVKGNTFAIKDELKADGARFSGRFRSWFFTSQNEKYETYELETNKIYEIYPITGFVNEKTDSEALAYIKGQQS